MILEKQQQQQQQQKQKKNAGLCNILHIFSASMEML